MAQCDFHLLCVFDNPRLSMAVFCHVWKNTSYIVLLFKRVYVSLLWSVLDVSVSEQGWTQPMIGAS